MFRGRICPLAIIRRNPMIVRKGDDNWFKWKAIRTMDSTSLTMILTFTNCEYNRIRRPPCIGLPSFPDPYVRISPNRPRRRWSMGKYSYNTVGTDADSIMSRWILSFMTYWRSRLDTLRFCVRVFVNRLSRNLWFRHFSLVNLIIYYIIIFLLWLFRNYFL